MKKAIQTSIDGISLNSRHFAAKTEPEAVKAIIADGFTADETWAKKAYKLCVEDVKKADAPQKDEAKK